LQIHRVTDNGKYRGRRWITCVKEHLNVKEQTLDRSIKGDKMIEKNNTCSRSQQCNKTG
jgi:hypothetical protein